jgi:hypothetical protein
MLKPLESLKSTRFHAYYQSFILAVPQKACFLHQHQLLRHGISKAVQNLFRTRSKVQAGNQPAVAGPPCRFSVENLAKKGSNHGVMASLPEDPSSWPACPGPLPVDMVADDSFKNRP